MTALHERPGDWLPIREASQATGYHELTIDQLLRSQRVPSRYGPRPPSRNGNGPSEIRYVHMPSLIEHKRVARFNPGEPTGKGMRANFRLARWGDAPPSITKLGTFLRQLRYRRSWTQHEVAEALGTCKAVVSNWERGLRSPSLHMAMLLCELYDLDLDTRWRVIEALAWKDRERQSSMRAVIRSAA